MKKRIIIIVTAILLVALVIVVAVKCGNGKEDLSNVTYGARTSAFFANIDQNSCWVNLVMTDADGTSCDFTQATDGTAVTTICDYEEDKYDSYEIYVGKAVHMLNVGNKAYDTLLTEEGQGFIFADYNQSMFSMSYSYGVSTFEGEQYYCEVFSTESTPTDNPKSVNKYYFNYDRLVAVEMVENGKTVLTLKINDYSSEIPEDILLSVPDDFRKGQLIYEHPPIDYEDQWGDLSLG